MGRRLKRFAARWVSPNRASIVGRNNFPGWGVPEIRRLKQLEDEHVKLKRLVADLTLDRAMLQDVLKRKW